MCISGHILLGVIVGGTLPRSRYSRYVGVYSYMPPGSPDSIPLDNEEDIAEGYMPLYMVLADPGTSVRFETHVSPAVDLWHCPFQLDNECNIRDEEGKLGGSVSRSSLLLSCKGLTETDGR